MSFTNSVAPVVVSTADNTTVVISLVGVSAGDNIIVGTAWYDPTDVITISSITVSGEANADLHDSPFLDVFNTNHQFASLPAVTAGGTKTVTVTMSGAVSFSALQAFAQAVGGGTTAFDAINSSSVGGTPAQVSLTPTEDNCYIVAMAECSSADPIGTPDTGFTGISLANLNLFQGAEYQLDGGTAGARNVGFPDCFGGWSIIAASFKPSSVAAPAQKAYPIADIDVGPWQAGTSAALRNLLTYTEAFDNAAWTKTKCTISADAGADPLIGVSADDLIEDSTTGSHSVSRNIAMTASIDYTLSVYVKPSNRDWVGIQINGLGAGEAASAFYNVSTGSVGTVATTGATPTTAITAAANGYYRISFTWASGAGANTPSFIIIAADADNSSFYLGNGLAALRLWGAQFEQASSASAYQAILATDLLTGTIFSVLADSNTGTPVDTDYGFVLVPGSTLKVQLGPLADPNVNTGHILSVRCYSPQSKSVQLDLYCASIATIVKTVTQATTNGVAQFDFTLSGAEADAIPSADYTSGLQLWMTGIA